MPIRIEHATEAQQASVLPSSPAKKKLYVKSYGCQMNVYDGLRIAELLGDDYTLQDTPEAADLVVLNTCHIREKADDKVFSDVGRIKQQMAEDAIVAVGGCTGQAMGAKVYQQSKAVSIVFGPQTYHRLPQFIERVYAGRHQRRLGNKNAPIRVVDTEFPELEKFDNLPKPGIYGPTSFLTIQEGCDKFCTYCVVPYTRGAEISRPVAHILHEAHIMADQGVKEITLLGQNVNAYHGEDNVGNPISFAKLIEEVGNIPGLERIRFTTSHPNNTEADLIAAFAANPKLMPFFHLPVQAGSNKILKAMNRSHTAESYLRIIEKCREARPDIAISGDFIVGFPGETEEDFQQTLAIVAATNYAYAYSFAYSPRPGTPAADMPHQVEEAVKKERLAGLQALLDDQQAAFNAQFLHKTVHVLAEEKGNKPGQLRGRSEHNLAVNFTASAENIGKIVPVNITKAGNKSLTGECVSS